LEAFKDFYAGSGSCTPQSVFHRSRLVLVLLYVGSFISSGEV
jgi:hypothetical protein